VPHRQGPHVPAGAGGAWTRQRPHPGGERRAAVRGRGGDVGPLRPPARDRAHPPDPGAPGRPGRPGAPRPPVPAGAARRPPGPRPAASAAGPPHRPRPPGDRRAARAREPPRPAVRGRRVRAPHAPRATGRVPAPDVARGLMLWVIAVANVTVWIWAAGPTDGP